MLPAPNTTRGHSSRLSVTLLLRRLQNNRQLLFIVFILFFIVLYRYNSVQSVQYSTKSNAKVANPLDFDQYDNSLQQDPEDRGTIPYVQPVQIANQEQLAKLLKKKQQRQGGHLLNQMSNFKSELENTNKCPEYGTFSSSIHAPFSKGPLELPFQRPSKECRTFSSATVEKVIEDFKKLIPDPDLARLFENCFPNTLDTTIRWHHPGADPQTFVVTGDIDAEWLRDSHKQLTPYLPLAKKDAKLKSLILGAINTQSDYVISHPYCNAFHPPSQAGLRFSFNNQNDIVYPRVNLRTVFECKYEIDSLASFLALGNDYYEATGDDSFVTASWLKALARLLNVLQEQSVPTYSETGQKLNNYYSFRRKTDTGTETLNLGGTGNPVNGNTSLIRSAFRPSDDATIFQFFIPGNAFMSVELRKSAKILHLLGHEDLASSMESLGKGVEEGIFKHGTYNHPVFGKVFAYEVDGFGSVSIMDDANTPSLLSLPDMGFVSKDNEIYLNTRRMILSKQGNPYYLKGQFFEGIGGPHIGTRFAWPMSHIIAMRTTDNDTEIKRSLDLIKKSTAGLGLMHESVNVDLPHSYTRSWFAWCNSEFAKTILHLAKEKPHLIFGKENAVPYTLSELTTEKNEPSDPKIAIPTSTSSNTIEASALQKNPVKPTKSVEEAT